MQMSYCRVCKQVLEDVARHWLLQSGDRRVWPKSALSTDVGAVAEIWRSGKTQAVSVKVTTPLSAFPLPSLRSSSRAERTRDCKEETKGEQSEISAVKAKPLFLQEMRC